jgi:peptide/nickel transport system substrate-binding protein
MVNKKKLHYIFGILGTSLLGLIALSSCGASNTIAKGGIATFAEGPAATPNYIFPIMSLKYFSVANISQFQYLMFRPLYWFGTDGTVKLNTKLSLAYPPVYSDGGKIVTITLKNWYWSNGNPITARDILFFMNLLKAEKNNWAAYVPGDFPDNVVSMNIDNSKEITFTLNRAYSSYWFTYNELSQITPLPQAAWDKESANGPIGNYDMTPQGAVKVYQFLTSEAANPATYATNPLWHVVDGPWELAAFDAATGYAKFVPNPHYSGPNKPKIKSFIEEPFTTDTAEFNEIKAGKLDYGYIPAQDLPQLPSIEHLGYKYAPWTAWQITYMPINFTNPTIAPIVKQLYIRQALQYVVNQPEYIKDIFHGAGYPTYGPVPSEPPSQFLSNVEKSNPYPYNPAKAKELLESHGWSMINGIQTCVRAGSGPHDCGAGIPAGTKLDFTILYASGVSTIADEMQAYKSDAAKIGIEINLTSAPFDTVISEASPCVKGKACPWEIAFWGGGWVYSPDYYPTGGELFASKGGSNSGGYDDPEADRLINETHISSSLNVLYDYEDYIAKQLPVIWLPVQYAQLSLIRDNLHGALPQDPLLNIYPENWYFTK